MTPPPATLHFLKPWSPIHIYKSDYFIFNLIGIGYHLFQISQKGYGFRAVFRTFLDQNENKKSNLIKFES